MPAPRINPPEACAVCGTALTRSARACPECGADERTGWREASIYDGLDLPAEPEEEIRVSRAREGLPWYWLAVGVLLLFLLGFSALGLF